MAWYSDEQFAMIEDCREKKSTAASAFKQRTHCGKGGGVKLPSDFMTKKEIKAMNGECVSYRMNDPITWEVFKTWPEEHQKTYISNVREKFKVPNTALAKAMGADEYTFGRYVKCLGLNQGKEAGAAGRHWHETEDSIRFWSWWNGEGDSEIPNLRKPMTFSKFKVLPDEMKTEYITWIREFFGAPDCHIAETLFRISSITLRKEFAKLGLCAGKHSSASKKSWFKESFIAWCDQNKKPVEEGPVTKVESTIDVDELFAKYANPGEIVAEEPTETVEEETVSEPEVVDIPEETTTEDVIEETSPSETAFQKAKERIEEAEKELNTLMSCDLACDCERKRIHDAGPIAFMGNQVPVIPKSGSMVFNANRVEDIVTVLKTLLGGARVNMTVTWDCNFED